MNLEDVPKFCDHTGEALNAAALALVREATSVEYIAAHAPAEGSILVDVPAIDVASGRHKYVLVQLSDPHKGGAKLVVRAYAGCAYHADNYGKLMRDLDREFGAKAVVGRVIGGGRIERDDERREVYVYGYSKTFGRTPGCNERTAAMMEDYLASQSYAVRWSDDGY